MGVENFCSKLPKGTPLRQIWSNESFGVCGSNVVLTLYNDDERKKVRKNRHWKLDVVYNTTSLPRRRDIGRIQRVSKGVSQFDRKFQMKGGIAHQLLLVSEN